ncbi:unnamed protein product [Meloidogyne enterolobii]|uniref:Uncharacterized protein n=1 Tax=Meloidogyne enterolobii TaxID=390850 RepID=A0ACB1AIN9_MELEN
MNHNSSSSISISVVFIFTYILAKIGIAYTTTMFSILPKIKTERQKNEWKQKAEDKQTLKNYYF